MTYFTTTSTTTEADLKYQYRELSKKHHPDKFSHLGIEAEENARQEFIKITSEYDTLMFQFIKTKLEKENVKFTDSQIWKAIRAGGDELLQKLNLSPLDELFTESICKFIDKVNLPPAYEKHRTTAKLLVSTMFPTVDEIAESGFKILKQLTQPKKK